MRSRILSAAQIATGVVAGLALAVCGLSLLAGMLTIALTIRAHDWLDGKAR